MNRRDLPALISCAAEQSGRPDHVLISSETFQALIWGEERLTSLQSLTNMFDSVSVIVVVRRQDVLLESLFKQNVKDPDVRLAQEPQTFMTQRLHWFTYQKLFSEWAKSFGQSNIWPLPYSNRKKTSLIDNVNAALSQITGSSVRLGALGKKNLSLNGEGLEMKWALNRSITDRTSNDTLLHYVFDNFDCASRRKIFNNKQRTEILDAHFKSNLWMFENFPRADWNVFQNVSANAPLFKQPDPSRVEDIKADFLRADAGRSR